MYTSAVNSWVSEQCEIYEGRFWMDSLRFWSGEAANILVISRQAYPSLKCKILLFSPLLSRAHRNYSLRLEQDGQIDISQEAIVMTEDSLEDLLLIAVFYVILKTQL